MIPLKPKGEVWTDEQWEAIYEDGKNIIVSAGAGSGKTAVLSERVIRKLKDGVHINQLLILTFTNAAAAEMAYRIRKKIKKIPELHNELNLLDSAYITTFDSFALSIVKKYHYLINISSKINIIDANVMMLKKYELMDKTFLYFYETKNSSFLEMVKNFCVKDDEELKKCLLNISNKIELLSNKRDYLSNYVNDNFNDLKIDNSIGKYINLIIDKFNAIKLKLEEISYIDNDFALKLNDCLCGLLEEMDYDQIVSRLNVRLPNAPRGSCQELKDLKSEISGLLKDVKGLMVYDNVVELKKSIYLTQNTIEIIIQLLLKYWDLVDRYKRECNCYEFNDIAIMAINILKNNKDVRDELYNSFNEIMIDEYQDTNDLQEEFISMISNHNVYMVGDIKQSIYRFRNANPYIFKEKYDNYSISNIDKKIDLNKNFRSRVEVIDGINKIFSLIMDQDIGGANYIDDHQMVFGNVDYLSKKPIHSNELEIYSYDYDKDLGFTKEEVEIFIIVNDIINKYNSKIKVYDKDKAILRDITYDDFSVIIDRSSSFDLLKKIFSYFGIPVVLLKDEKMNDSDDVNVIRNVIKFIILIKNKKFNDEFKYLFLSIYRSFLYRETDENIFSYFYNNNFKTSDLYKKCNIISRKIDSITIVELLEIIEKDFSYYQNLISIGNIENSIVKMDKMKELALNLEGMGYDIESFSNYLEELTSNELNMNYKVSGDSANSVKVMTIHKSKGLEYPICYFCGLYKKFNVSDLKERFLYDKVFGLIVPYFKEGIGDTIYKELLKEQYIKEEISEKIRLFYVALTRAREKIILINPYVDDVFDYNSNVNVLPSNVKMMYRSFADIINSISYQLKDYNTKICLDELRLSHDYNNIKVTNFRNDINKVDFDIFVDELNIKNNIISKNHFSKSNNNILSKTDYNNMSLGVDFHEILELIDFKHPDYEIINNNFYVDIIKKFLENDIMANVKEAIIYKEFEFIYYDGTNEYHGIIDLMLEYNDHIDIIDYKLKNVVDNAYKKQLEGYKKYIELKSNKNVNLYLYSILDSKFYLMN